MITTKTLASFTIGFVVTVAMALSPSLAADPLPGKARLNLVFILDGLRPDSVNPEDTPNIYKLREQGMNLKWISFDSYQSVDSRQILRQRGFTILMVEQNFRFASGVGDRFYVIEEGRVAEHFDRQTLASDHARIEALLGV